jgi:cytochrome c oxidase subunit II
MNGKFPFSILPEAASAYAGKIDVLFYAITAVTIVFSILIFLLILVFALKFRRKKGDTPPPATHLFLPIEIAWTVIPLLICLGFFVWGCNLFIEAYSNTPKNTYDIYVTGKQWMWKYQHPTGRREINDVHLPVGQNVRFIMVSEDVIHDMFIPAMRMKHDVLPMRYSSMWFRATMPGNFHIFCSQYCGTKHSAMVGTAILMNQPEFENWLSGQKAQQTPAERGRSLFESTGCIACHQKGALQRAPLLEGVFGTRVKMSDGRVVEADENYVRKSILDPKADVVEGYQPIMPTYAGRLSEDDLIQVVAYIKSLGSSK